MDITELILSDHHEQRRMFATLDDIDRADTATLSAVWKRLQILLEVHAAAEEKHFYPELMQVGVGEGSKDSAEGETRDAVHDHNEIRDAIAKVADHEVGSDGWWGAVAGAREENSDHMGEEERESLADFRRHASLQLRHDLAVKFAAYEAEHAGGIDAHDRDVDHYIDATE
ncbi:hemerythrin domain-containing protein [Dermatophilaceae bacterium Sec6.4]